MIKITKRQKQYLFLIIKRYIATGQPVGSSSLISLFNLSNSSATVRNEMVILEKLGLLEKSYISSGRIPSALAFTIYAEEMKNYNLSSDIKEKLNTIFSKRIINIDSVLEEAAEAISFITNATIITNINSQQELLKSIQLVPLNDTNATIILVSSSGRVESKLIDVSKNTELEDVKVAIRVLKDRLIDTPLKELSKKTEMLVDLISPEIKNYEFVVQQIISKVFNVYKNQKPNIYGMANIMNTEDFTDTKKLVNILNKLEQKSIWELIESQTDNEDETLKMLISNNQALISKKIQLNNITKEISIIGSKRLDYEKAIPILNYIEELVNIKK